MKTKIILILLFIFLTFNIIKNNLYYTPLLIVYILLFFNLFAFSLSNQNNREINNYDDEHASQKKNQ